MKPPLHLVDLRHGPLDGVHAVAMHSARSFGRHWHEGFGFGVMDEGTHRTASARGPVTAQAGDIITVNPGEVHDGIPLDGQARRWRMVYLTPAALGALTGHSDQELTRPVLSDTAVRQALHAVFQRWDALRADASAWSQATWEEALATACGLLALRHGHRKTEDPAAAALQAVRECLLDQMSAPPSLDTLARLAGLSRFQLVRQFARAHGLPPFAWLQQHRLRQARELIATGTAIGDAAFACGFADQSHLHRHFQRSYGFTPGAWQRACHQRAPRPQ
ncbi:MAG: AraC family transcriptional regulator [Hydrogenophaga sp.]|nr:AraC family transcriptional regulator [Hydrogenophaga sp.]